MERRKKYENRPVFASHRSGSNRDGSFFALSRITGCDLATTSKEKGLDLASPIFFSSPQDFRFWLEKNGAICTEVQVGYHKVHTGLPSLSWSESVDEALCFGWIDGVRRSLGKDAYCIRFTPRKQNSIWSQVNLRKMKTLLAAGRVMPQGQGIYEGRKPENTGRYAFEQKTLELEPVLKSRLKKDKKAWLFFLASAKSYQKLAIHWVMSAKRESTKIKRFEELLLSCAAEEKLRQLSWTKKKT